MRSRDQRAENPAHCLDEPLFVSAPIALREAQHLCGLDPETGMNCAWYHGVWQYLRILDLASAADRHAEFYRAALAPLARDGRFGRVLVSGAADYSMAALILHNYAQENAPVALTAIDLCESPLYMTRWYAERTGHSVATKACSVLGFEPDGLFDVICTHSFFGRFAPARRPELIAAWHRLLRPGGRVITANRVRPAAMDGMIHATECQIEALCARGDAAIERNRETLGMDRAELATHVRRFAECSWGYPLKSAEDIRCLFEQGGFSFDRFETDDTGADPGGGLATGPSVFSGSAYVKIVAYRD